MSWGESDRRDAIVFAGEGLVELTLAGDGVAMNFGGDAANAALMCARLGGAARLLGRVGADPFGQRLLSFWRRAGIDVSHVAIERAAPTGLYANEVVTGAEDANRRFTYWRQDSAGSRWCSADLDDPTLWSGVAAVVLTGITVTVSASCAAAAWKMVEHARRLSIPVAFVVNYRAALNPDPELLNRLAVLADVLIGSVDDLAQAFPTSSPVELFELMQQPEHELVLTAGPAGATVSWSGGTTRQPAPSVAVRDTVGAGDALAGTYLWARFQQGFDPAEALAWGVAAGSLSVQRDGCANSYPDRDETTEARAAVPAAPRELMA